MGARQQLAPVTFEERPWPRDSDALEGVPKSRRRLIASTYQAAVPASIAQADIELPSELAVRLSELLVDLARFDALQLARGYDLSALLLRSESSASSQIEHLTSSVRNVALAEVSPDAPHNAQLIAGNVAAMRTALSLSDELTVDALCTVHRCLIEPTGQGFGGKLRDEQVWVGGSAYSPHGALFVPPHVDRVLACLDDLVAFSRRDDLSPVVKAAVLHAQFETIHPFVDGNGRTGRTLLHKVLRHEGVLEHTTLPISVGLLHDIDTYMTAIRSYQQGDPVPVVTCVADALEVALGVGGLVAQRIGDVLEGWRTCMSERKGSSMLRLPDVLVEQPVVNGKYLAVRLGITERAAANLLERACSYGILRPIGNARRGVFYQADELIAVLERIADTQAIRRILSTGKLE